MLTYQELLSKKEIPSFIELYKFTFLNTNLYLTSYPEEVTINNITYKPCVMERSEITKEKNGNISVIIAFATKENEGIIFLNQHIPKITCIITRYFLEAGISKVIFVGESDIVNIHDRILSVKFTDLLSLNKKTIPPLIYSAFCNNTLFDTRCKILKENYRLIIQVVTDATKTQLIAGAFSNFPQNYFVNGYVEYRNEYRFITSHIPSEQKIIIHAPFLENINGKQVFIYPGCDKSAQTCKNKFNNLQNFLGFPYIPKKNPAIWGF